MAAMGGNQLSTRWIQDWHGRDVAATTASLLFAAFLTAGMCLVGSCPNSFVQSTFSISRSVAFGHVTVLLLVPPLMHLATFWGRILSQYASVDDWCDWFLSIAIPYLLLVLVGILHRSKVLRSPYGSLRIVAGSGSGVVRLDTILPAAAALLASLALQYRYLIPLAHACSYQFMGVQPPAWMLSAYWTIATVALLAAAWLWGRRTSTTREPLLGEYQEDVVQLCLALTGLALGKGLGMPWNFTPLPILAFLGLSLWLSTRMLRYLSIFMFVIHAAAFVTFTYRFAGINQNMRLSFPGLDMTLIKFGMLVISASLLVGMAAGLAVRSTGGVLSSLVKRMDLTGILMVVYSVLLLDLELSLLEREANRELAGVTTTDEAASAESLYGFGWVCLTSAVLIGIAVFMKRVRILKPHSAWAVISLAAGKALSLYTHVMFVENGMSSRGSIVFIHSIVISVIFVILVAPSVFLAPVHLKTSSRYKLSLAGGSELPGSVRRTLLLYNFVFLPVVVLTAVSMLDPVLDALLGTYRESSSWMSFLAETIALWSLASLAMLNHYLPDGGGEFWKKLSALSFLGAMFLFFAGRMLSATGGGSNTRYVPTNPYVVASSIGGQLDSHNKRRTGGWGLLSACLASLLAMTKILELRERKSKTGVKDRFLLFRTLVFSLLFGGGVTWFIIVQTMSEAAWSFLVLTMISSMTLAFLGTVATVFGYFIELENFDEVEQLATTWVSVFPALLIVVCCHWTGRHSGSGSLLSFTFFFERLLLQLRQLLRPCALQFREFLCLWACDSRQHA